jgi:ribosomal protein S18 acetylase RimI-like enzyme
MSIEEYFHDFRIVHPSIDDLNLIFALESICFPPDEAAAISSIRLRIEQANPYFIVLKSKDNDIIGFVNATLSCYEDIHHESMTTHHQDGHFLVIHSVSIHPNYRRKGYGKLLLEKYILEISNFRHEVYEILLLSKAYLLSFYNSVGFTKVKMSTVTHGQVI